MVRVDVDDALIGIYIFWKGEGVRVVGKSMVCEQWYPHAGIISTNAMN